MRSGIALILPYIGLDVDTKQFEFIFLNINKNKRYISELFDTKKDIFLLANYKLMNKAIRESIEIFIFPDLAEIIVQFLGYAGTIFIETPAIFGKYLEYAEYIFDICAYQEIIYAPFAIDVDFCFLDDFGEFEPHPIIIIREEISNNLMKKLNRCSKLNQIKSYLKHVKYEL